MPDAENFSFVFNTLLSDIAVCCPEYRERILQAQIGMLETLVGIIEDNQKQERPVAHNNRRKCKLTFFLDDTGMACLLIILRAVCSAGEQQHTYPSPSSLIEPSFVLISKKSTTM
jgi:hypothetical protein